MKINAQLSILINQGNTTITIKDDEAAVTFVEITLTPQQLSSVLSRLANVDCEATVVNLDKIGKTHENKFFEFEAPKGVRHGRAETAPLNQAALKALQKAGMSEWVPDNYYGSQNTFFSKDDKDYARVIIRRWTVKPEQQ